MPKKNYIIGAISLLVCVSFLLSAPAAAEHSGTFRLTYPALTDNKDIIGDLSFNFSFEDGIGLALQIIQRQDDFQEVSFFIDYNLTEDIPLEDPLNVYLGLNERQLYNPNDTRIGAMLGIHYIYPLADDFLLHSQGRMILNRKGANWGGYTGVEYRLSPSFSLEAGYQAYDLDRHGIQVGGSLYF